MLRLLLLLLVLANAGFYAWSRGHLVGIVPIPPGPEEPERLKHQVHPEAIQIKS
jgi:hypothetical protein